MIGASKGGYRRSPGGGSVNKKKSIWGGGGGVSPMGVLFMWAVFSLHVRGGHAISPCVCVWGGDLLFCMGGRALLGLPHHNNFCGSLLSQKYFQIVEVLIFLRELFEQPKNLPPAPAPI